MMVIDVIFPGWVPFKELALAQDVPGFVAVHEVRLPVPGQGLVFPAREDAERTDIPGRLVGVEGHEPRIPNGVSRE